MSFVSSAYFLFLALIAVAYWRIPPRGRMWLLLVGSYIFYGAWDPRFLALLLSSTVVDFYSGLAIVGKREPLGRVFGLSFTPFIWLGLCAVFQKSSLPVSMAALWSSAVFGVVFPLIYHRIGAGEERESNRRKFLRLSVLSNLGVLCFFKYAAFFSDGFCRMVGLLGWHPGQLWVDVVLPIAVSFYTFQSICYAVDIYRCKATPIQDFVSFAAYLSFFPQLVAGPIERPGHLVPQFLTPRTFRYADMYEGAQLLLTGFFKKVFVADNCAILADYAFDPKTALNAPWVVLGTVAFAFQIYGDFSGYTDIARGSALLLGFRLSPNFRFPYFAKGPSDFWQRWHISLSSWFRDYVYIPLGGNRRGALRTSLNLMITMLLAGLWHGASWTFVLWGAYHGGVLILYRSVPWLGRLERTESGFASVVALSVMTWFTCLGWIVFRSVDVSQCLAFMRAFTVWNVTTLPFLKPALWLSLHCLPLLLLQLATSKRSGEEDLPPWHWSAKGLIYAVLFIAIASSAVAEKEFIYFQF